MRRDRNLFGSFHHVRKLSAIVVLFVAGYFLYFISGNAIVAIVGCLLLGLVFDRKNVSSAWKFGSPKEESLVVVDGRRLTRAVPLTSRKGTHRTVCPSCGSEAEASDEFCINCGHKLLRQEDRKRHKTHARRPRTHAKEGQDNKKPSKSQM